MRRLADPRRKRFAATIDWSHELLSEDERALLARLSVFVGGFTLRAVAAVCVGRDEASALQLLVRLVESSLVVARPGGATRYRLLETIREYAAERLDESGAAEEVRRRHANHFLEIARQASPDYVRFSPQKQKEGLAILDAERDNLHAALTWALANQADLALPLAAELRHYWLIRGYLRQGLDWLDQALGQSQPTRRSPAPRLLSCAAELTGDFARAEEFAVEGIAVGRTTDSARHVVTCLNVLTTLAGLAGDYERAHAHCDEAVALARGLGSRRIEAIALFILAEAALHTRTGTWRFGGWGRALELARDIDDGEAMALALIRLGMGARTRAPARRGLDPPQRGARARHRARYPGIGAICCDGLAAIAIAWGDPTRAARLLGAAESLRRASGGLLLPADAAARDQALAAVQQTLPRDDIERALEAGSRLGLEGALRKRAV